MAWDGKNFSKKGIESIDGISRYYAPLLPQDEAIKLDCRLDNRISEIIRSCWQDIPGKSALSDALKTIHYFSDSNILKEPQLKSKHISEYLTLKSVDRQTKGLADNKRLIRQRKNEYRKLENDTSELIIDSYGTYIGIGNKGITIKTFGKKRSMPPTGNLQHITVIGEGVSISSNAIGYCMQNRIGIDFFSSTGEHHGSILSDSYISTSLWDNQNQMTINSKMKLAAIIITGKIKNQINLIKYFHKYHKNTSDTLIETFNKIIPQMDKHLDSDKKIKYESVALI